MNQDNNMETRRKDSATTVKKEYERCTTRIVDREKQILQKECFPEEDPVQHEIKDRGTQ